MSPKPAFRSRNNEYIAGFVRLKEAVEESSLDSEVWLKREDREAGDHVLCEVGDACFTLGLTLGLAILAVKD